MKKANYLAACFLALAMYANAQYFQAKYGQDPYLGANGINGMIARSTGAGHLLGGLYMKTWSMGACNDWGFFVTRTNPQGGFTSPTEFNNSYYVSNASGAQLRISSSQVVEYADGSGYGVIFTYYPLASGTSTIPYNPGTLTVSAVGFAKLDVLGNVMLTQAYSLPWPNITYGAYVTGLSESVSTPGDILATGELNTGEGKVIWAMRIDQVGTLLWGNIYYDTVSLDPFDIIESPYSPEAYIVGSAANGTVSIDAFWMRLDVNLGTVSGTNLYTGTTRKGGNHSYFRAIAVSSDPVNPGFIICGYNNNNYWLIKTDTLNNLSWWRTYNTAGAATPPQVDALDVVGRLNASGNYEYYVTGILYPDAVILKVDQFGSPVNPGALFIYDTGREETPKRIDVNTSGSFDGVSIYGVVEDTGSVTSTQREGYIVKAYFNGVSGCNESFEDLRAIPSQVLTGTLSVSDIAMSPIPLGSSTLVPITDVILCNADTLDSGSNARPGISSGMLEAELVKKESFAFYPNPANSNDVLFAFINSRENGVAELRIADVLGKIILSDRITLRSGDNELKLNLGHLGLPNGLYNVTVSDGDGIKAAKLVISSR